jgi:hypothetical protein
LKGSSTIETSLETKLLSAAIDLTSSASFDMLTIVMVIINSYKNLYIVD